MNLSSDLAVSISHFNTGGHTSEMLRLMSGLDLVRYAPRLYVLSTTDLISETKLIDFEQSHKTSADDVCIPHVFTYQYNTHVQWSLCRVPRSREVRQSWVSTVFSSAWALLRSLPIPVYHLPDLVRESLHASPSLSFTCRSCAMVLARASRCAWPLTSRAFEFICHRTRLRDVYMADADSWHQTH